MTPRPCILPPPLEDDRDTDPDTLACDTRSILDAQEAAWCPDGDGMAVYWSTGPEVET